MNNNIVKSNKEDKFIRDLFRQELENAEVAPDVAVKSRLLRRLSRREFLRFNPGRFNVYYLGTVVTAAVVAALIIYSGTADDRNGEISPVPAAEIITLDVTDDLMNVEKSQPAGRMGESVITADISGSSSEGAQELRTITGKNTGPKADTRAREQDKMTRYEIPGPVAGSNVLSGTETGRNILQGINIPRESLIVPALTTGCIPLKVQFKNNSASSVSSRWSFGDGGYSDERDPEWIYDIEGEYKVILNIVHPDGRKEMSSAVITAYPRPVAYFELIAGDPGNPDDEVRFINYSTGAVKYVWEFGDGNTSEMFEPRHNYARPGNYNIRLTVYSESGCHASQTVLNAFAGSGNFLDFPNAFVPNPGGPTGGHYSYTSDITASIFHPVFSDVTEYQLRIFSKRGILIFESNDINVGWDGYLNGQLCEPGVYIWKARGRYRNGETFTRMGDLTLLRSQ